MRYQFAAQTVFQFDAPAEVAAPIMLTGLCVPWDATVPLSPWGDTVEFAPGSIAPPDPSAVKFCLDHRAGGAGLFGGPGPKPFGYGVSFEDRDGGLWGTFAIPRDELADPEVSAAVRQMRNGVRSGLSVMATWGDDDAERTEIGADWLGPVEHHRVKAAQIFETSTVVIPRFDQARVASIAATAAPAMASLDPVEPVEVEPVEVDPDSEPDPDDVDPDADDDQEDPMGTDVADPASDELARLTAHRAATTPAAGRARPVVSAGRFESFGAYAMAVRAGKVDDAYQNMVRAALVQQGTVDTPGIVPELWIKDIVDILGQSSATVDAFSQRPLPASGMIFNVPRVDQLPDVGLQPGEFGAIPTRKVLIGKVPFNVQTYAGGQAISYQELERSDPSYIDELMRLYAKEMAIQMNTAAAAAIIADAGLSQILDPAMLNETFIDAAAQVLTATLSWPGVVVLGVGIWKLLGKAKGTDGRPLFPGLSPMNPIGSFALNDASGNVRGLSYWVDPLLPAEEGILGIAEAFRTYRGGMRTLGVDVPGIIAREVAVYEYAAMGVTAPNGLVHLTHSGVPGAVAAPAEDDPAEHSARRR